MLLALRGVEIGYERPILPPIDLEIHPGQRVGILGPNGAGKSTLLRTIIGLLPALSGKLEYPLGRKPRVGYVPQSHRPDPAYPLSTHEVVLQGRYPLIGVGRRARRSDHEAVSRQLAAVGLTDKEHATLRSLSGGQRQRAMVARALVAEPELLILDEPTSEMDPAAESDLLELVAELSAGTRACVLFVTHEISAAAGFATTLALINHRTGLVQCGPARDLLTSEHLSRLYDRPVELRNDGDRTLVWMATEPGART